MICYNSVFTSIFKHLEINHIFGIMLRPVITIVAGPHGFGINQWENQFKMEFKLVAGNVFEIGFHILLVMDDWFPFVLC